MKKYTSWKDYFDDQPPRGKKMLFELKEIFEEILPNAIESWGYGVPAYDLIEGAMLEQKIMISGFKSHVSIYPGIETIAVYETKLKEYKILKSTVQISHKQELPTEILKEMILHRYNTIVNKNG